MRNAGSKFYQLEQLHEKKRWSTPSVSAETIRRCWFRTKIIFPRDENGISVIPSIAVESIDDVEENLPLDSNEQQAAKEL
ncbi:2102_t:CDS:2 [Cetraspora pellucida]|uniref:2102_t:CDS:1 n=1 Tax=Cetraspora pellucida TaxID=1433469 RepID=A0A9N9H061_9GLOM|nr:2102_t:CDS:2 [Cetraspora pellucida]